MVTGVVAMDLAIYLQHRVFHYVPVLWRLHRVHHADLDVDVTTGARFHPLEILMSLGIKFVVIVSLGAPNVRLPQAVERVLRWFIVTPDMHRVHHSILRRETDSNFGFNLPWWDRLFGTYRGQPEAGHEGMTLGIEQFRDPKELRLDRMLTQPFRDERFGSNESRTTV